MLNFNPKKRLNIYDLNEKIINIKDFENNEYTLENIINQKIKNKE